MATILVIFFLSLLIIVHELGHFFAAKIFKIKVEEFGIGFPPKIWKKKMGETEYALNALPLGGYVKIFGENNFSKEEQPILSVSNRSFSAAATWKKSIIILSGVFMNLLFAWFLFSLIVLIGIPSHLTITGVAENSPADNADLKPGDIITKAVSESSVITDPLTTDNFLNLVEAAKGQKISLTLIRNNSEIEKIVPVRIITPEGEGLVGITIENSGLPKEPFPKNLIKSASITGYQFYLVNKSLYGLVASMFQGLPALEKITGPVGIFVIAAETGKKGIIYLMELMAFISVNLAALNLFPFPALDGGRFVVTIIEKLKGSLISFKTQAIINSIGFILLILLILVVSYKDITHLLQ